MSDRFQEFLEITIYLNKLSIIPLLIASLGLEYMTKKIGLLGVLIFM